MTGPTITTSDGVELETILQTVDQPRGAIVLCHPHPQHGGTMRHPLIGAIAKRAVAERLDVLRFNFRSIGESTGEWGNGIGEGLDVAAAVSAMQDRSVPVIGIAGWSFGAATALRWQATSGSTFAYVGVAPPVDSPLTPKLPEPEALQPASRTFIVGNRDQFVDADALEDYAGLISAGIIRYETADHFFVLRHDRLAEDVVSAIGAPEGFVS